MRTFITGTALVLAVAGEIPVLTARKIDSAVAMAFTIGSFTRLVSISLLRSL